MVMVSSYFNELLFDENRLVDAPLPSDFSHPYSIEASFNLWYEPLNIVFACELTSHVALKGLNEDSTIVHKLNLIKNKL